MLGTHSKKPIRIALSELDKEDAARFTFEYFARVRLGPLTNMSSLSCMHRLRRTLELMTVASSMEMQEILTSILTPYPRSAGASNLLTPHRTLSQRGHNILSNFEKLLLYATRTLSCQVHHGAVVPRERLASPRPNENHHRKGRQRRSADRRRKFGSSRLSLPRHGPTPPRPLRWQRSASLPDLAGALIDFVHVSICVRTGS